MDDKILDQISSSLFIDYTLFLPRTRESMSHWNDVSASFITRTERWAEEELMLSALVEHVTWAGFVLRSRRTRNDWVGRGGRPPGSRRRKHGRTPPWWPRRSSCIDPACRGSSTLGDRRRPPWRAPSTLRPATPRSAQPPPSPLPCWLPSLSLTWLSWSLQVWAAQNVCMRWEGW